MPVMTLNTVDLPAPLGPITLTISRSSTWRSSSEIARRPPKARDRWSSSSSALMAGFFRLDGLHPPRAQQPLWPRRHGHDQDRPDHDLGGDGRVDDQP